MNFVDDCWNFPSYTFIQCWCFKSGVEWQFFVILSSENEDDDDDDNGSPNTYINFHQYDRHRNVNVPHALLAKRKCSCLRDTLNLHYLLYSPVGPTTYFCQTVYVLLRAKLLDFVNNSQKITTTTNSNRKTHHHAIISSIATHGVH